VNEIYPRISSFAVIDVPAAMHKMEGKNKRGIG